MIVLSIMAFIMALAVPTFIRYQLQEDTRAAAQQIATAIRNARDRAIREGRPWLVLFDSNYNPGDPVLRIVQDMNGDYVADAGDVTQNIFYQAGKDDRVERYGVTPLVGAAVAVHAGSPRAPNDTQPGNIDTEDDGVAFPDSVNNGGGIFGFGFNPRGVPVDTDNNTNLGSGIGAFYVTDNDRNVYAVVVSPLGEVRVRALSAATGQWQ